MIPLSKRFDKRKDDIRYQRVEADPNGDMERATAIVAELSAQNKGDAELRNAAIRAIGGNLAQLRKAKGWFDEKSGKIVIVLNNHRSVEDIRFYFFANITIFSQYRQKTGPYFPAKRLTACK
ncbi:MAG: hypothetical protein IJ789_01805 [Bacteroidales bacterium]|nr:hypothetical protein [Bacteroidales bacterium]